MRRGLLVLGLFVVANFVIFGVQKIAHYSDQKELDAITLFLEEERPKIEATEMYLLSLQLQLETMDARLSELETDIQEYEHNYPSGIPSSFYPDYSAKVDEYNSLIDPYNQALSDFDTSFAAYQARVDAFNSRVDDAERLAAKIGGTWIIVPKLGAFIH